MSFTITPGTAAPDFSLPGVDGQTYTLDSFSNSPIIVVAFTCNHCPYVIGSEDRLIRCAADYAPRGVALVAINSNETANHPEDDFPHMVDRAHEKGYNFPYLRDEKQDAAKVYGAIKTPHFFVIDADRKIRYTGRMDNNPKDETHAATHELRDAVDDLLAGRQVAVPVTDAIGCTIKWWNRDRKFIPNDVCDLI
jgi:peroxiredoxin